MSTFPLQTPTALLTSLFASLPPLPPTAPLPSNPLLSAPPSTKSLFLTLHALFPNEFLPALDLLDRGLVTRVVIGQEEEQEREREREQASFLLERDAEAECRLTGEGEGEGEGDAAAAAHDAGFRDEEEEEDDGHGDSVKNGDRARARAKAKEKEKEKENSTTEPDGSAAKGRAHNSVYYVHSAASTAQRPGRSRYAGVGEKSYEVRLRAWNCSCPAFTFSAFSSTQAPSLASARRASVEVDVGNAAAEAAGEGGGRTQDPGEGEEWVFGGLSSLWAAGEESVPVCKHLLACAVGERCGLLSRFVVERVVGRGEAAGLGAGWSG